MKRYIFLLLIACISFFYSKATTSSCIAIYNVDSVIAVMPEYPIVLREFLQYDSMISRQDSLMQIELRYKITRFATDSSKFSAMVCELKKREIEDLTERIHEFREAVSEDMENKKRELLKPLKEKIATEVINIGKDKKFTAVICEGGYVEKKLYFNDSFTFYERPKKSLLNEEFTQPVVYLDLKIKTINITSLLIEKLKK
jgi:outer membrane protein